MGRDLCSVRSQVGEHTFHEFRRSSVGAFDQVAVNRQRDRGRAVSEAAANGQRVHAGGDQL
jgi:hypothetical protein